jgi:hypothetical protein
MSLGFRIYEFRPREYRGHAGDFCLDLHDELHELCQTFFNVSALACVLLQAS